ELCAAVESLVGANHNVGECDGELPGLDADAFLSVAEDDVVSARLAGASGLASRDVRPRLPLDLQGHVLGDVPEPRPVGQALEEPAGAAQGAGVIAEARQEVDQR